MRKTTVVPFLLVIFVVVLGASSARIGPPDSKIEDFMRREREYGVKTRDPLIQVSGRPKPPADFAFGDNPAKTSRRRLATPQNSQGREPSIQAYGLPKRTVADNGFIERVNFDRTSGLDGKVDKVNSHGKEPSIQAFGLSKRIAEDNGFIERVGENHDEKAPASSSEKFSYVRRTRSVDESAKNDLVDLEGQEAKVFRPLFVYRQQVADRYRVKPRKNPIYGAYQYGTNGKKNSIQRSRNYY